MIANIANQSLYYSLVFKNKKAIGLRDNQDGLVIGFKILRTIEFTSERRMMTVIVQSRRKKIFAFTKGADSAVLPLVDRNTLEDEKVEGMIRSVENFTHDNLRVMIYAYKEIKHFDTKTIETMPIHSIEKDLKLIGVTGVKE